MARKSGKKTKQSSAADRELDDQVAGLREVLAVMAQTSGYAALGADVRTRTGKTEAAQSVSEGRSASSAS